MTAVFLYQAVPKWSLLICKCVLILCRLKNRISTRSGEKSLWKKNVSTSRRTASFPMYITWRQIQVTALGTVAVIPLSCHDVKLVLEPLAESHASSKHTHRCNRCQYQRDEEDPGGWRPSTRGYGLQYIFVDTLSLSHSPVLPQNRKQPKHSIFNLPSAVRNPNLDEKKTRQS